MAAGKPIYWRPRGDKAIARSFERDEDDEEREAPPSAQWEDLRHGDLLYNAAAQTHGLHIDQGDDGSRYIRELGDSNSEASVGLEISKMIEDPLDFYTELYQGITSIYFDAQVHADILKALPICPSVDQSGIFMWTSLATGTTTNVE
jgi:hypothetical protein